MIMWRRKFCDYCYGLWYDFKGLIKFYLEIFCFSLSTSCLLIWVVFHDGSHLTTLIFDRLGSFNHRNKPTLVKILWTSWKSDILQYHFSLSYMMSTILHTSSSHLSHADRTKQITPGIKLHNTNQDLDQSLTITSLICFYSQHSQHQASSWILIQDYQGDVLKTQNMKIGKIYFGKFRNHDQQSQ